MQLVEIETFKKTYEELESLQTAQKTNVEQGIENHLQDFAFQGSQIEALAEASAAEILAEANMQAAKVLKEKELWEQEKSSIASTHHFESCIKLDIGGQNFTTCLATLTRFSGSLLGVMFSGRHAVHLNDSGAIFIDRDSTYFRYILNFLRAPEAFAPALSPEGWAELAIEAEYYGLRSAMFPSMPLFTLEKWNPYGGNRGVWYLELKNNAGIWTADVLKKDGDFVTEIEAKFCQDCKSVMFNLPNAGWIASPNVTDCATECFAGLTGLNSSAKCDKCAACSQDREYKDSRVFFSKSDMTRNELTTKQHEKYKNLRTLKRR